jgi:hypothetical protein
MATSLSTKELQALQEEDPFLFKLYVLGIRQYMDYETGITGIKRRISWQSLAEECYVAPRSGVKKSETGKPKHSRMQRAIETLKRLGLIEQIVSPYHLIFECLLATSDKSVQKQVDKEADKEADRVRASKKPVVERHPEQMTLQADAQVGVQADIPPSTDITDKDKTICQFLEFWKVYPRHENKLKASKIWTARNLDKQADIIIADVLKRKEFHCEWLRGFIPHATTYLNGKRWEDDIREESNEPSTRTNGSSGKQNPLSRAVSNYIKKQGLQH